MRSGCLVACPRGVGVGCVCPFPFACRPPSCLGLLAWWRRVVPRSAALWSRRSWRLSLAIRLSPRSPVSLGGAIICLLAAVGYRRTYSSSRRQCGHSMIVVLLALSCLTRAVPGIRCPHHWQKLYSSFAEAMNTRRRRGGVGFPVASFLSSCLLVPWAWVPFSSSRSAWIAHWPNVRSLPGATCRCRSNRYSRSSAAGRAGLVLSLPSPVSVSRAACLYRRVISAPRHLVVVRLLVSSCVSSPVGPCLPLFAWACGFPP